MSRIRTAFLKLCLVMLLPLAAQAEPITITDIAGRTVNLPKPAEHVVLSQARYLPVLAMIHPDPVSILAGWSDEFRTSFADEYAQYKERFPDIDKVAVVGRHTADSFSVEKALALNPDLLILTASFAGLRKDGSATQSAMIKRFEDAGIPVLVVDFFIDPLNNTVPSLRALGQALGREAQAEALIQFYEKRMQRVAQGNADLDDDERPKVLVHAHAGTTDCCASPGIGTFNDMVTYAGGHNIGADVLRQPTGRLALEYILQQDPSVYVATGTGVASRRGLLVGTGKNEEQARDSLRQVLDKSRLSHIAAVRDGNAHGIWHAFNDSPLHVVFIEALAKWIAPERFADVDPAETLKELNERFLAVPMTGTFLVDLAAQPAAATP